MGQRSVSEDYNLRKVEAMMTRKKIIECMQAQHEDTNFTVLVEAPNGVAVFRTQEEHPKEAVRRFNNLLNGGRIAAWWSKTFT